LGAGPESELMGGVHGGRGGTKGREQKLSTGWDRGKARIEPGRGKNLKGGNV